MEKILPETKLDELLNAASKATKGPWTNIYYNEPCGTVVKIERFRHHIANCNHFPNGVNNATFIALADPAVITALVVELKWRREKEEQPQ